MPGGDRGEERVRPRFPLVGRSVQLAHRLRASRKLALSRQVAHSSASPRCRVTGARFVRYTPLMRGNGITRDDRVGFSTFQRLILLGAVGLLASAHAVDVSASVHVSAPHIRIIPTDDVLQHYTTETPGGELLFLQPSGVTVKFVTDPQDPEIVNPGSGAFHPPSTRAVVDAVESVDPIALRVLDADIFILPFPRSGHLSSSAGPRDIYISPGVLPYADMHVHFLVAHELGHCLHRQILPETDLEGWAIYRKLRGIDDPRFDDRGAHAFRPREIFAEDFRVLFGGDRARGDGTVENSEIVPPDQVPGLREFFVGLLDAAETPAPVAEALSQWTLSPNPMRAGASLVLHADSTPEHRGDYEVEIFDLAGRQVRRSSARPVGGDRWYVDFPSRGEHGQPLPAGSYWMRLVQPERGAPVTPAVVAFRYLP